MHCTKTSRHPVTRPWPNQRTSRSPQKAVYMSTHGARDSTPVPCNPYHLPPTPYHYSLALPPIPCPHAHYVVQGKGCTRAPCAPSFLLHTSVKPFKKSGTLGRHPLLLPPPPHPPVSPSTPLPCPPIPTTPNTHPASPLSPPTQPEDAEPRVTHMKNGWPATGAGCTGSMGEGLFPAT